MKKSIKNIVENAVKKAIQNGDMPVPISPDAEIEAPKIDSHGDFSSNIAMVMASAQKMPPRKLAEIIIKNIEGPDTILARIEIAGPGFMNFFINEAAWHPVLKKIHHDGDRFGSSSIGKGKRVQVEFVSANPTGPLHVGHGRGAAVGDAVANILSFCGHDIKREYYINDSGRQIQTLGRSVFLRLQEFLGESIVFPDDCYQGAYIKDIARTVLEHHKTDLDVCNEQEKITFCATFAAQNILEGIKSDLLSFGVTFDLWYSEQSLFDNGKVEAALNEFKGNGHIYEKDGALWFNTSRYGDEKDRVVVRNNGQTTYFASDIAYHQDKFKRGFDKVVDVWGADHHGYIPRLKASIEASGKDCDQFHVILIQLVNLLRAGEPVAMSTRSGEFDALCDVINEVGKDAARFIFLSRHYESPLDFDLELAKKKSNDNPVYYVQYVHARIESIIRKGKEENVAGDMTYNDQLSTVLNAPEEIKMLKILARYPEVVEYSAIHMEPHRITFYLMELASAFHGYYNKLRVLTDDPSLTSGRLYLIRAVQQVIKNGLVLLGVSAPLSM
ncbi:MAG: arginine--tRNA ligase [Proteobacteria bacterium]|nr:arginine--tRNA ligase [Pseudomonadota bacterium]